MGYPCFHPEGGSPKKWKPENSCILLTQRHPCIDAWVFNAIVGWDCSIPKKGRPITDLLWYDHSFWEHDKLKTYQASHGCFLRANGG